MTKFCPYCGSDVELDSIYCLNCGKKLPDKAVKATPTWEPPATQPRYDSSYQPQTLYKPIYQPRPYHPAMKAEIFERCIALLVDNFIVGLLSYVCIGIFYECLKDSIREGQSVGKGLFNMRVIDYQTGMPATAGQSFIRNCLCACVDISCCYLIALVDADGRRIGDHVAGTVVIKDI